MKKIIWIVACMVSYACAMDQQIVSQTPQLSEAELQAIRDRLNAQYERVHREDRIQGIQKKRYFRTSRCNALQSNGSKKRKRFWYVEK